MAPLPMIRRLTHDVLEKEGGGISMEHAGYAFALVIVAGMCTAVGAAAVFVPALVELASKRVLAVGLAFAAGAMIYVSCLDIFAKSYDAFLEEGYPEAQSYTRATLTIFAGMLLMKAITKFVHCLDPNHDEDIDLDNHGDSKGGVVLEQGEQKKGEEDDEDEKSEGSSREDPELAHLKQMGVNTALAIALHNMPEGLATFVGYLGDEGVGVALAIGIGFHNIPEGLCVALPIYYATGSRLKGFLWAVLSGVSEPIGAILGWCILKATGDDIKSEVYAILFGLVGGMMIFISIHELLPEAFRNDPEDNVVTTSCILGMAMLATSLCLFQY